MFFCIFVFGFIYLFVTNKTPYEKLCKLEESTSEQMEKLHNLKKDVGIFCSDSVLRNAQEGDILLVKKQFIEIDSVYDGYVGIVSCKGNFIISNTDISEARAILYKKDSNSYLYAEYGIVLEYIKYKKKNFPKL
ncbi:MAG: hypothetical protein WC842_03905 [Candidatus Paceibacterota bacterium]